MGSLSSLEAAVQEGIANRHKEIVLAVYQFMLKRHNDINCGCDYCSQIKEYVQARKNYGRMKRTFDSEEFDYECYYNNHTETPWRTLDTLKWKVKQLKIKKDSLKLLKP